MRKEIYILTAIVITLSLVISCQDTTQGPEVETEDPLVEKARSFLIENNPDISAADLSVKGVPGKGVPEVEGHKIPTFGLASEPGTHFMVVIEDGVPDRILIQEAKQLENGNTKLIHSLGTPGGAAPKMAATATVNKQGETISHTVAEREMQPSQSGAQETVTPCFDKAGPGTIDRRDDGSGDYPNWWTPDKGWIPIDLDSMEDQWPCNGQSCFGFHYSVLKELIQSSGDSEAICDFMAWDWACNAMSFAAADIHCESAHNAGLRLSDLLDLL